MRKRKGGRGEARVDGGVGKIAYAKYRTALEEVVRESRRKLDDGVVRWRREDGVEELRIKFPDVYAKESEK